MAEHKTEPKIVKIAVLGVGGVGELAARLLHDTGFEVTGVDMRAPHETVPFRFVSASVTDDAQLEQIFADTDAVLSCLPYHLNKAVARKAAAQGLFYFDLTEDVPTTQLILELSADCILVERHMSFKFCNFLFKLGLYIQIEDGAIAIQAE